MADYRLIYVTGMKPKPPVRPHRELLLRVLDAALTRHDPALAGRLQQQPDIFTLVSWTSLLYDQQRAIERDLPGVERLLAEPEPSAVDRKEIDRSGRRLARYWHLLGDSYPSLTRIVANPALRATLAEVRRYLEDREGIGSRIRALLTEPLKAAWQSGSPVMLIGHSLGSVLAYDALWELSRREGHPGRVSLFLSLGSPIATRFIRVGLCGADLSGGQRYPSNIERWVNVSARGELVALHPRIGPFFRPMRRLGLTAAIEDYSIYNHFHGDDGLDVHKSYGYLNHPLVAGVVARWLRECSNGS